MPEFEELRLTVTLVDNASQGLASLRQNLRALASGENLEQLKKIQKEVEEVSRKMKPLQEQMGLTARAAQSLARGMSAALASMATAFVGNFATESLKKFTDEVLRLNALASQIGVSGGQIKGIIDQMKLMGVESGAGARMITNFSAALADMSRLGSEVREKMMKEGMAHPEAMQAWITRMTGFANKGDMIGAMNEMIQGIENIYENERNRPGGSELKAAEMRNKTLRNLGIDPETYALIKGRFKEITAAEETEFRRRADIAKSFSRQVAEIDTKWREFVAGMQEPMIGVMQRLNALIGDSGEEWGKFVGEKIRGALETVRQILAEINAIRAAVGSTKREAEPTKPDQPQGPSYPMFGGGAPLPPKPGEKPAERPDRYAPLYGGGATMPGAAPVRPPRFETPAEPLDPDQRSPSLFKRMSYTSGSPIMLPGGATRASYARGNTGMQEFTRIVRTGVFEGLVDFRNFMQGGGGGGGFQRAAFQPGGGGGFGPGAGTGAGTSGGPSGGPPVGEARPPSGGGAGGGGGAPSVPSAPSAPSGPAVMPGAQGIRPPGSFQPQGGGGGGGGGGTGGQRFSPDVNAAIDQAAKETGVSPTMLSTFAGIESSGKPGVTTGSYKGLFQLSETEFRKHGGTGDIFSPLENARAAARKLKSETEMFRKKFGRDPEGHELYMMHQQGWGGLQAHLKDPNRPAWESMLSTGEGREKGERWAKAAIWGNLPESAKREFGSVENVTSGQFMDWWKKRYGREEKKAIAAGSTPGNNPTAGTQSDQITNLKSRPTDSSALDASLFNPQATPTGPAAGAAPDQMGDVRERQQQVAGTRKGQLDPRLRSAFAYASERTGLAVDVTSGGQRMHGAPGAVGSHRHDRGRAADFNLKDKDGNIVPPNDPRALDFYRYSAQAGVTGGGASYMDDPNKIHLDIETEKLRSPVYAGSSQFRTSIAQGKKEKAEYDRYMAERRRASQVATVRTRPDVDRSARAMMDSDMGGEIKSRVEGTGDIKVDVTQTSSRGKGRRALFKKLQPTPAPTQMEPAAQNTTTTTRGGDDGGEPINI